MSKHGVSEYDDVIDIRDVIEEIEALDQELEELRETAERGELSSSGREEREEAVTIRAQLSELLDDCEGLGGDEQYNGSWYRRTLIRDSYFRDYAEELAEGCGMIPDGLRWPLTCIDWDKAAMELKQDYSAVEFRGVTYWAR